VGLDREPAVRSSEDPVLAHPVVLGRKLLLRVLVPDVLDHSVRDHEVERILPKRESAAVTAHVGPMNCGSVVRVAGHDHGSRGDRERPVLDGESLDSAFSNSDQ
jgi:hypothetical protein